MAGIELKDITKRYPDGTEAVKDLSLSIADGEFVILVGPSGCGKSTALRMIAGLEDITEGELLIGDRVVNELAPKDRDIAMVFQSYALYPHMTVRENMGFALELAGVPKEERNKKVEEAAAILDLQNHLERKPANLSGGQRQRVAMGRAIVRNPKAFLMDEPLSNLDAKLRVQMRTEVSRIQQRVGTTTVYVTHDQTEAMTLGDRDVTNAAPKDRDIAMVFQSYALYPHMTVRENLEFGLRMRRTPRAEVDRLVADAADVLGIKDLLERKPKQLSGGQRQRVAVGRAIVRKPDAFLFDEPLSNLDAKMRVQMRVEISKLHNRLETTMIYVTHDQVEAMTMGDRIV
ncbi:MAG TPA: ATP-binding cassette domain-containing protein, partial [Baekduia sp.]|nr:ATP-binding cassette domain-containing protein [Baekduia sp.]